MCSSMASFKFVVLNSCSHHSQDTELSHHDRRAILATPSPALVGTKLFSGIWEGYGNGIM